LQSSVSAPFRGDIFSAVSAVLPANCLYDERRQKRREETICGRAADPLEYHGSDHVRKFATKVPLAKQQELSVLEGRIRTTDSMINKKEKQCEELRQKYKQLKKAEMAAAQPETQSSSATSVDSMVSTAANVKAKAKALIAEIDELKTKIGAADRGREQARPNRCFAVETQASS